MIRPYVELLSSKPPEWLNYTRIYIVPVGNCGLTRHLANLDQGYASLFPTDQELKIDELTGRLQRYLSVPSSAPIAQLPLGEAMLTCQDDSSQLFVPFLNVRRDLFIYAFVVLRIRVEWSHFLHMRQMQITQVRNGPFRVNCKLYCFCYVTFLLSELPDFSML